MRARRWDTDVRFLNDLGYRPCHFCSEMGGVRTDHLLFSQTHDFHAYSFTLVKYYSRVVITIKLLLSRVVIYKRRAFVRLTQIMIMSVLQV